MWSRIRHIAVAAVTVGALVVSALPSARALLRYQSSGCPSVTSQDVTFTTLVSLAATTGAGIMVGLSTYLTVRAGGGLQSKEAYVRQNALALQRDLTVGGGSGVRNLAVVLGVDREHHRTFARALRQRSDALIPLTRLEKLNEERAAEFFRRVAKTMELHPELRDELRELRLDSESG